MHSRAACKRAYLEICAYAQNVQIVHTLSQLAFALRLQYWLAAEQAKAAHRCTKGSGGHAATRNTHAQMDCLIADTLQVYYPTCLTISTS
eukprot:4825504-Pleurochrysis_carterae.AAC.7